MQKINDLFRPVYELWACVTWFIAIVLSVFLTPVVGMPIYMIVAIIFVWRLYECINIYRFRIRMQLSPIMRISHKNLEKRVLADQGKSLWLGKGFIWTQRYAQASEQMLKHDTSLIRGIPIWLKPFIRHKQQIDSIGQSWIHSLSKQDSDLVLPMSFFQGHTLIAGTTGAGKTRLYELISTQIIYQGSTLLIIDPKGDRDWENRVRQTCKRVNRRFLYLHPAHPDRSIRLQPLMNWNSISEPAGRISQLVDADGSFLSFAWRTLFVVMRAMASVGIRPNISGAKDYVLDGVAPLLEKRLQKRLFDIDGENWQSKLVPVTNKSNRINSEPISDRLLSMITRYESLNDRDEVTRSLIAMIRHPREHYQKMSQVLQPIMSMLGDDELGRMLSPDPLDLSDDREIWDTNKIINMQAVLYVGLDSLSNRTIGSALGSILLADFASVAGAIYNFSNEKKPIFLMIDEAAEVMNEQAVQLLNKGRGAGIHMMIATQTIADFDALFGNRARTRQTLGNLNNVICLRIRDTEMAEFISQSFGQTISKVVSSSNSVGENASQLPTSFATSRTQLHSEKNVPLVSDELLMRLPSLQYFACVAGSTVYKGCLPLIDQHKT